MRYWFHSQSGGIAGLRHVWAQAVDEPADYWPESLVKRDRASGIEAGPGDYFIARKKPTTFVSSDGRQPPGLTEPVVDGYSSGKADHCAFWVNGDYFFWGGMLDLKKATAHWQCNCMHYQMQVGTGKCRAYSYSTFNYYTSTGKDNLEAFMRICESHFVNATPRSSSLYNLLSYRSDVYNGTFVVVDQSFNFRYGEWQTYQNIADMGIYLNGSASRFESAFVNAWESLPSASANGMANILEAVSTIRAAIEALSNPIGAVSEFATNLADPRNAWLAYRYQYKTTRADVEEYISLWRRLKRLRSMCKHTSLKVTGSYSDETGTYGCVCRVDLSTVIPQDLEELLSMCGLRLNASNLWDMVPYSFVVDWFIKLGDILQWFERWEGSFDFKPKDIWYTYRSAYDDQRVYYRVRGVPLGMLPAYSTHQVSDKTILMRVGDSISLFT